MENTTESKRNPYQKKIEHWEAEIDEIQSFVSKLPDVNIINLPHLLNHFFKSSYSEIEDKQERLQRIKSGVMSMNDTIRHVMTDDSSCVELGGYVRQLVRLGIEVDILIDKLSDKNAIKYWYSIMNK